MDLEQEARISVFLESMAPEQTEFLNRLEGEALEEAVPIIRPQTRSLLCFFLELCRPVRILEIGTGTGFSACFMLTYAPDGAEITTIERDPERAKKARMNLSALIASLPKAHGARHFTLLEGDALSLLREMNGPFDLIFLDAAKGQYLTLLSQMLRLMRPGGLLISDNILQNGMILESRFAVPRRNRTIHQRMRSYLKALTQTPELQTLLLQEGDGLAVCVRKENGKKG